MLSATILLVEDDVSFMATLRFYFRRHFAHVVSAGTAAVALAEAKEQPPRFAVVDLRLPDRSGLDVLCGIKAVAPTAAVLMCSGYGDLRSGVDALRMGAFNFVQKPTTPPEIHAELLSERAQPGAARVLPLDPAAQLARAVAAWQLTPRQAQVVEHLAKGTPSKLIAAILDLSLSTVEAHASELLRKSGSANRAELIARFWRL